MSLQTYYSATRNQIDVKNPIHQFIWFTLFALLTRFSAFGDSFYTNDEPFYFLVGQRAWEGFLPYVDIWDRKGPGLFFLYYLISGVSNSILAYQIAALLAATATAWLVARMAMRLSTPAGAVFGGTLYLALLPLYGGGGGQSPVFYNLLMACAAALVLDLRVRLLEGKTDGRLYLAMASAGFSITFKQTAFVESVFLGCYCVWQLRCGGMSVINWLKSAFLMASAGAAPMLLFGIGIAALGHFPEFWDAMVNSNLNKSYFSGFAALQRLAILALYSTPATLLAVAGVAAKDAPARWSRPFLTGWLIAGAIGVALIPNYFGHYLLPFMLPASVAASLVVFSKQVRPAFGLLVLAGVLLLGPAFNLSDRAESRAAIEHVVQEIRRHDPHPRLLVYEGPVYLYRRLNSFPPTPLLFPMHLSYPHEDNASQHDTAKEMRRILAWKPTVVVKIANALPANENRRTAPMIRDYIAGCRLLFTSPVNQVSAKMELAVYGDCKS